VVGFNRPSGTLIIFILPFPSVEPLGYYRISLREKSATSSTYNPDAHAFVKPSVCHCENGLSSIDGSFEDISLP
jgi:hypothetical protein